MIYTGVSLKIRLLALSVSVLTLLGVMSATPASAATFAIPNLLVGDGGSGDSAYISLDIPAGATLTPIRTGIYNWAGLSVSVDGQSVAVEVGADSLLQSGHFLVGNLAQHVSHSIVISAVIGSDIYTSTRNYTPIPLTANPADIQIDGWRDSAISYQLSFGGSGATYTWLWDKGGFNPDRDVFGDHLTYGSHGVVTGTTPAMGWEQFTVNATGGSGGNLSKKIWIVIADPNAPISLVSCSISPTPPCVQQASIGGSPITVNGSSSLLARKYARGFDTFVRAEGVGDTNTLIDVTFDMGTNPTSSGYFAHSSGRPQVFSVSTVAGHQHVRVVTKPAWASWVANSYPGPYCMIGNCGENLVGGDDLLSGGIYFEPVGNGGPPASFAGGWVASNAQSLSLGVLAGQLSFDVAAPHFRRDGTTVNHGFYEAFIPRQALADVFQLPTATAADFIDTMTVANQTNGGNIQDSTRSVTATDFNGGIKLTDDTISYSWHKITIAPKSPSGGSSSGGTGGSSSSGSSTNGSGGGGSLHEILGLRPASGPLSGGNSMAIVGYGFTGALEVRIGDKPARFTFINDAHIEVVVPPGEALGPADVSVVLPPSIGRAFAPGGYVYTSNSEASTPTSQIVSSAASPEATASIKSASPTIVINGHRVQVTPVRGARETQVQRMAKGKWQLVLRVTKATSRIQLSSGRYRVIWSSGKGKYSSQMFRVS